MAFSIWHSRSRTSHDSLSPRYDDVFGKVTYAIPGGGRVGLHVLHAGDRLTYLRQQDPSIDSHYLSDYLWLTAEGHAGSRLRYSAVAWVDEFDWRRTGSQVGAPPLVVDIHDARTLRTVGLRQDWSAELGPRALCQGSGSKATHNARPTTTRSSTRATSRSTTRSSCRPTRQARTSRRSGDQLGVYISQRVRPIDASDARGGGAIRPRLAERRRVRQPAPQRRVAADAIDDRARRRSVSTRSPSRSSSCRSSMACATFNPPSARAR